MWEECVLGKAGIQSTMYYQHDAQCEAKQASGLPTNTKALLLKLGGKRTTFSKLPFKCFPPKFQEELFLFVLRIQIH